MSDVKDMLDALKQIKQEVIKGKMAALSYGLCHNYLRITGEIGLREKLFNLGIDWINWPKFSGDDMYPVPPLKGDIVPSVFFGEVYFTVRDMWEGQYGNNRMELLDWLIEQLEKKLCE